MPALTRGLFSPSSDASGGAARCLNELRQPASVLFNMENFTLSLRDGEILLERLLEKDVDIAHDCGGVLACTSCRVVIREGFEHLHTPSNDELDMLDRADSRARNERLACQVQGAGELVVQITAQRGASSRQGCAPGLCQRACCQASGSAACETSGRSGRAPGGAALGLLGLSLSR